MKGNEAELIENYVMESVSTQLLVFAVSFFAGIIMILIYTAYSGILDRLFPERKSFRRLLSFSYSDVKFWIVSALVLFYVYYRLNNASVRPYCFMFIFAGMAVAYNVKILICRRKKTEKE